MNLLANLEGLGQEDGHHLLRCLNHHLQPRLAVGVAAQKRLQPPFMLHPEASHCRQARGLGCCSEPFCPTSPTPARLRATSPLPDLGEGKTCAIKVLSQLQATLCLVSSQDNIRLASDDEMAISYSGASPPGHLLSLELAHSLQADPRLECLGG